MRVNMVGAFIRNAPFGTEIAFKKGLERIGVHVTAIDTSYPDQVWDMEADATIVFKWMEGYWEELAACKGPKIVYQPDDARFPHIREMILKIRPFCDLFLSFDGYSADVARTMGYRAAETLLLTADDELYSPSVDHIERDIDVAFIGSLTGGANHASRRRMCDIVRKEADAHGWTTAIGSTEHMPTILDTYRRAKVVLNHATDVGQSFGLGFGLQCRHFEVGMTRTALLSNSLPEEDVPPQSDFLRRWDDGLRIPRAAGLSFYRFTDERSLLYGLNWMLGEHRWELYGRTLYDEIVRAHLPQHRAVQLVDFIRRNS